jgi:hypothetical protein
MAEKAFFGATKSEMNRFKNEVNKDYGLGKIKPKPKSKSRKRKKR